MNSKNYNDLYAFHPGYYINQLIEDMGVTQEEFAVRMGVSAKTISLIVNGEANLSDDMALKLSNMYGTSVDIWLNLQSEYSKKILEIEKEEDMKKQIGISYKIDYSYFVKNNFLPNTKKSREKVNNLRAFLNVSSLETLNRIDYLVNFRSGIKQFEDKNIINANVWLQTAMNIGRKKDCCNYNETKLKSYLGEMRSMTLQDFNKSITKLDEIFKECGVCFVFIPKLKNCGINGAVKWIDKTKVLLAINDRMRYSDVFWFSLFHEIKHVMQKKITKTIINGISQQDLDYSLEYEANEFSKNILIPKENYANYINNCEINYDSILTFASSINIHPGIVVGRLINDDIISPSHYQELRTKIMA